MRIALVGQPNCGKSTLFNQVAGYKAETGNFSGTTVTFTESRIRVAGEVEELVDLPGTYSLVGTNPAESETQRYLASNQVDVIINIIDATHLAQGLDLTLELLALKRPMVVGLNMMDEAMRIGLSIDGLELEKKLGVKVLPLIASRGQGIKNLFLAALQAARQTRSDNKINLYSDVQVDRHKQAADLAKSISKQGNRRYSWRDNLDIFLLDPVWGFLALIIILFFFFQVVYGLGSVIEGPILKFFDQASQAIIIYIDQTSFLAQMVIGVIQGISGGFAIVLPYLVPFLLGLSIMEDAGYLPRVAFLMDNLMHRLGLHGKAIVPFILGYGCNVPAVMSTRILEEKQDRFLAAALSVLVPCAARLSVVFGLVAFYLGPLWALGIYIFNIFVIALTGRLLTLILPDDSPGLILEMPVYRVPTIKAVISKVWFRVREFIVEAWPLLIIGSMFLALLNYFNVGQFLNILVRPFTWVLGLPTETGVPLMFGILRKELSLVMLRQALGVADFSSAMTSLQMLTFTVFVVFYIPCLPTLTTLKKELGGRNMIFIACFTLVVALVASLFARGIGFLILG